VQFISLGSLLIWVPLVPAYFGAFAWRASTRLWRIAVLGYWTLLVPTGWALFLPGILDHVKFTDSLVGHSILAMAGFASSLLILILAILLDEDGQIFNARWPFLAWHVGTLGYVILFFFTGWKEGGDPAFTIVPGPARDVIYAVRLVLGMAMTAASAYWLVRITGRIQSRGASYSDQPSSSRWPAHSEVHRP
jgi:cytochrome c oxidase cbb3-type subunit I